MNIPQLWEMVRDREAWRAASMGSGRAGHDMATEEPHRTLSWRVML